MAGSVCPNNAHSLSNDVATVFGFVLGCQPESVNALAGVCGKAAPPDWDPVNFLIAEAGTALCVIHVDDVKDDWGVCYADDQRQTGYVQLVLLDGTNEFIFEGPHRHRGRVRRPCPEGPRFGLSGRSHQFGVQLGERRCRAGGTRCWNCASSTSWRQGSSWQQGRTVLRRRQLRAGVQATCSEALSRTKSPTCLTERFSAPHRKERIRPHTAGGANGRRGLPKQRPPSPLCASGHTVSHCDTVS